MKKIILINGLIASGKNTIGQTLTKRLEEIGHIAAFYDLDVEVTRLNPKDFWVNDQERLNTWLRARKNYAHEAINNKESSFIIIAGPFIQKDELDAFIKYLDRDIKIFLFTIDTPLEKRIERNKSRTPSNNPKDIVEQEENLRRMNIPFYGETVDNKGDINNTVNRILDLIGKNRGELDKKLFE